MDLLSRATSVHLTSTLSLASSQEKSWSLERERGKDSYERRQNYYAFFTSESENLNAWEQISIIHRHHFVTVDIILPAKTINIYIQHKIIGGLCLLISSKTLMTIITKLYWYCYQIKKNIFIII